MDAVCSLPFVAKAPKFSLPCSQLFIPNFGAKYGDFTFPRSSSVAVRGRRRSMIFYRGNKRTEQCFRVPFISCSMVDGNGEYNEMEQSPSMECQQLPRRRLLVTFTCDACGVRSQRLINRLAYERGLVYVQCSGCSQYHKLVDNLGLVIEYNLEEEIDLDAKMDQV
ncbi:DNL-type zinc finger protein-like isoform X4 [Salvia splendens]|uniref:DNL-type zinc finger protein-like isoform X4 n=1 Tax=Salvia splendens TaxID=180675 RepID=UPI001C2805D3|nr:DNL-type zinc finger protein-like isoform X4 [Salvia splendens]